ncbi:hypothetical protein Ade02nite_15420 [Paractinoplanes deccanensis]|uniref:Uncharacterized protein n=1 Tax=Paractinoplanes deccanensis TaxID=113561 RepID=A0ABQ3XYS4_9ACTN|nr:hypothetical protein [Actinoplanes deccanensis]GID72901.1 hypothetical protein Ade02nite_15420 [Actinoplanes deccanensis]
MLAKRIVTVVATLLAIPGLGARGAAATETRRDEPAAIAPAPARNLPPAFPFPAGSQVTRLSDGVSGASFTLTEPDPQTVLSFYRRELTRAPFTIVADRTEHGTTSLAFRDTTGWAGSIHATTHRVTVAVARA